jgi:hypothetical protein
MGVCQEILVLSMFISELIQKLQAIADVHGNLPVSVIDGEGWTARNVDSLELQYELTADWRNDTSRPPIAVILNW